MSAAGVRSGRQCQCQMPEFVHIGWLGTQVCDHSQHQVRLTSTQGKSFGSQAPKFGPDNGGTQGSMRPLLEGLSGQQLETPQALGDNTGKVVSLD